MSLRQRTAKPGRASGLQLFVCGIQFPLWAESCLTRICGLWEAAHDPLRSLGLSKFSAEERTLTETQPRDSSQPVTAACFEFEYRKYLGLVTCIENQGSHAYAVVGAAQTLSLMM